MTVTKILVCGGRAFGLDGPKGPEFEFIISKLEELASELCQDYPSDKCMLPENIHIIAGKAKGADNVAVEWAIINWLPFTEYPADWDKYGKAAGYVRNRQMLKEGQPDIVVAFPGGKGTDMMVKLAEAEGVRVIDYRGSFSASLTDTL